MDIDIDQQQQAQTWAYSISRTGEKAFDRIEREIDLEEEEVSRSSTAQKQSVNVLLARETVRMISWNPRSTSRAELQRRNISPDWGEYYLSDPDELSSSDDEEVEEAIEVCNSDEEYEEYETEKKEIYAEQQRLIKKYEDEKVLFKESGDSCNRNIIIPSLMGMPDIILEEILLFMPTNSPSNLKFHLEYMTSWSRCCFDLVKMETVCKRFHQMVRNDMLWKKICINWPLFRGSKSDILYMPNRAFNEHDICRHIQSSEKRSEALQISTLCSITVHQLAHTKHPNDIINVLDELGGSGNAADMIRDTAAKVLSRMNAFGLEIHFRLRGDTLGYLIHTLQTFVINMLEDANLLALNRGSTEVCTEDILIRFKVRPHTEVFKDFKVQEFQSGVTWRWPKDGCYNDTLPAESGRMIIRRLAYRAGVREMSSDAFVLAEDLMLRVMGTLLVDALEATIKKSKHCFLNENDVVLVYNSLSTHEGAIDMFTKPPPPMYFENDEDAILIGFQTYPIYTIVPGSLRDAAKARNIGQAVYGNPWVTCSGYTAEEERVTEETFYFRGIEDNEGEERDNETVEMDNMSFISRLSLAEQEPSKEKPSSWSCQNESLEGLECEYDVYKKNDHNTEDDNLDDDSFFYKEENHAVGSNNALHYLL